MRKWLIGFGILVLLLVGAAALAAYNLNAFLDANRDRIAAGARDAIGRDVGFGEVGVSWSGGIGVRVRDLRVGDDPAFSPEPFLTADALEVQVKLWPALFGRMEVGRFVLDGLRLTVIQTAKGLSTDSLAGGGGERPEGGEKPAGETQPAPALLVSLVDIEDGSLRFIDRRAKPPAELRVDRLDFSASELSLTRPVEFELAAAVLGSQSQNLRASGTYGPLEAEAPRADVELHLDSLALDDALRVPALRSALPPELSASGPARLDLEASGTLAALRFDVRFDARGASVKLGEGFDKASGVPLSLSVRGERNGANATIEALELVLAENAVTGRAGLKDLLTAPKGDYSLGAKALTLAPLGVGGASDVLRDLEVKGDFAQAAAGPKLRAAVRSSSGALHGAPYRDLALDLRSANQRIDIEKLSLAAFEGALSAKGVYDQQDPERPRFDVSARLTDMRVEQLLENQLPAAARFLSGKLGMNLDLGGVASEELERSLSGDGAVHVADGVIRDFNPAGPTLRAILELPVLSNAALRAFFEEHPQVFGVGDTPFQMLDGKLRIRDGWVDARDFALETSDYVLSGSGRYSLDNALDFDTVLTLSTVLSEELVAAQSSLRYLRTPDGRVAFPVDVRGSPPKLAAFPDVTAIGRSASRELLTGALEKALRGKQAAPVEQPGAGGTATAPPAAPQPETPPAKPLEDLTGELLRRGLGEILRDRSAPPE